MAEGKTLWELLMEKMFGTPEPPPLHTQLTNPLDLKLGQVVNLDVLDFRGTDFRVSEIRANTVRKAGKTFKFAEYVLGDGDRIVFLRIIPSSRGVKALVGELYDEFGADTDAGKAVPEICQNDTEFNIDNDEQNLHEKYFRVDDVRDSYKSDVIVLDSDGLANSRIEYWDFWRNTEIEGVETTQYLYVEKNPDTGIVSIKRNTEVDPNRVVCF